MQVNGTTHAHGPQSLQGPHRARPAAEAQGPSAKGPVDQLDISPAAQAALDSSPGLQNASGIRSELVNRIRQEIAGGTYETPAKIDAALERLLDELG
jgi:negative regulator of flagellin synthesis FlgM